MCTSLAWCPLQDGGGFRLQDDGSVHSHIQTPRAPFPFGPPFFSPPSPMSKRSATELLTPATTAGQPYAKASGSGSKRDNVASDEMGEFEDAWEDEIESDEEVVDAEAAENSDGLYLLH